MALPVIMPRQGQSVESCIVTKWFKQPGDSVAVGDILFSYETDKAAFEEASSVEGTLLAAFFEEGDDVPVLTNMCVIGASGEDYAGFAPNGATSSAPAAEAQPEAAKTEVMAAPTAASAVEISGDAKISPRAKALAERSGAQMSRIIPTGPEGRVIARDVQAAIDAGFVVSPAARAGYAGNDVQGTGLGGRVSLADLNAPQAPAVPAPVVAAPAPAAPQAPQVAAPTPTEDSYIEPLTRMRKAIAKSMVQSLSSMAQLTHNNSFDCTEIQAVRKMFKDKGAAMGMDKITLNDIILYAVSRTLAQPEHRALNANLVGDNMKYFRTVNLGMAVDTDRGLMVPTLFGADKMSLKEISETAKRLAKECQSGSINPDYLTGGSFTVSNLGALGIETFTPVINPPQTGILGVNTITTRVKEEADGTLKAYPCMCLSLTYDHRALDGAPASKFLRDLKNNLENFTLLLARG